MSIIGLTADEIVKDLNLTIPINLNKICENYNIKILYRNINSADGYFIPTKKKIIISNKIKGTYKERFTISHELGHYFNVNDKTYELDAYCYSDYKAKQKQSKLEREADEFAAELLMPKAFTKKKIENIDIKDWKKLIELSLEYEVSLAAMLIKYIDNSYGKNRIGCFYNNRLIWQYGNQFDFVIEQNILNGQEKMNLYTKNRNSDWIKGNYDFTEEVLIDKGNIKYLLISVYTSED